MFYCSLSYAAFLFVRTGHIAAAIISHGFQISHQSFIYYVSGFCNSIGFPSPDFSQQGIVFPCLLLGKISLRVVYIMCH